MTISQIARNLERIPLGKQITFLQSLVNMEKENPRSHRFIDLQLMLQDRMTRFIAKQNAAARRA